LAEKGTVAGLLPRLLTVSFEAGEAVAFMMPVVVKNWRGGTLADLDRARYSVPFLPV